MRRDGHTDEPLLAAARGYEQGNSGRFNSLGRPQRGAPVRRFSTPSPRVATPPSDPKDNKCANCSMTGHTKENCPKPQISIEDRNCRICSKTGHIARKCPDNDKAGHPSAKPAVIAKSGASTAIVPYRNRTFLWLVTVEEGYQQLRRPKPKGVTFGELPVPHRQATQRLRKTQFCTAHRL